MIYNLRFMPFVVIGIITLVVLLRNVIKNRFSEKESFFWAIAGLIMLFSPLYMDYIDRLASSVGVEYAPSLIFALLFIFVFFLLYRQSSTAHNMNEIITELIQLNAIYENELRTLREKVNTDLAVSKVRQSEETSFKEEKGLQQE